MELTYEVQGNGYTIFKNGEPWIVQKSFIPYPGATVEESAENHINTIIDEMNSPVSPSLEDEIEHLKDDIAELLFKSSLTELEFENIKDENAELMLRVAILEMEGN